MHPTRNQRLRWLLPAGFAVAGGVGGYLYYRLVGCASGVCVLSANPCVSTLYCGVIGLLVGFLLTPAKRRDG